MSYIYEEVKPWAEYAPWHSDPGFVNAVSYTHGHTLVDGYRMYELWKLTAESGKLSTGDILEVGAYKGGTGAIIAKQASISCPDSKVYLCDTFGINIGRLGR